MDGVSSGQLHELTAAATHHDEDEDQVRQLCVYFIEKAPLAKKCLWPRVAIVRLKIAAIEALQQTANGSYNSFSETTLL